MTISDRVLDVLVDVSEIEGVRHDPDVRLYDLQILDSMQTVRLIVALSVRVRRRDLACEKSTARSGRHPARSSPTWNVRSPPESTTLPPSACRASPDRRGVSADRQEARFPTTHGATP